MKNQIIVREEELVPGISCIWHSCQDRIDITSVTIPFLNHEVIFNLGDHFSVSGPPSADNMVLSEIRTSPVITTAKGKYETIGLLLTPTGVWSLFGLSLNDFIQAKSSPAEIFAGSKTIIDDLRDPGCAHKAERLANALRNAAAGRPLPHRVDQLIKNLVKNRNNPIHLKTIAAGMQTSPKHLIACFNDVTGLTPLKFVHLLQINNAIRRIYASPHAPLTDIALTENFFDQAHFIRTFRRYTGITPGQYRTLCRQGKVSAQMVNTLIR